MNYEAIIYSYPAQALKINFLFNIYDNELLNTQWKYIKKKIVARLWRAHTHTHKLSKPIYPQAFYYAVESFL